MKPTVPVCAQLLSCGLLMKSFLTSCLMLNQIKPQKHFNFVWKSITSSFSANQQGEARLEDLMLDVLLCHCCECISVCVCVCVCVCECVTVSMWTCFIEKLDSCHEFTLFYWPDWSVLWSIPCIMLHLIYLKDTMSVCLFADLMLLLLWNINSLWCVQFINMNLDSEVLHQYQQSSDAK